MAPMTSHLSSCDPNVTCTSCAARCCRMQVLLFGDNAVPAYMTEANDWGGTAMRRLADGWCTALNRDTLLCTIYGERPGVCRDYAMGGAECIAERAA